MAFPQGVNFRATSGFVTDGADEDYTLGGLDYPKTTAQGNTIGWEDGPLDFPRDRNAGNDRRLAGMNGTNFVVNTFRIDLPSSGNYDIRIAAGDPSYLQGSKVELFDGTSSLGTLATGNTSGGGVFKDATDTNYSAANWPGSNTAVTKSFTGTICRFKLGDLSGIHALAHVHVAATGGGGGGGTQSYSYTATGGLTFGGTSSALRGRVASASGGLLFGGTSAVARGRTVTASGGLVFGGVSTVQRGATRTATGGITFGGTAAAARGGSRVASGGIVFGGSAPFSSHNTNRTVIASGGIVFGGTSGVSYGGGTVQQFGDELISAFVVTRASIYSSIRSILCR